MCDANPSGPRTPLPKPGQRILWFGTEYKVLKVKGTDQVVVKLGNGETSNLYWTGGPGNTILSKKTMAQKQKTNKVGKCPQEPTVRLYTLAKVVSTMEFEDWYRAIERRVAKLGPDCTAKAVMKFEEWYATVAIPRLNTIIQDVENKRPSTMTTLEAVMTLDIE